jgi:hypothetical protein
VCDKPWAWLIVAGSHSGEQEREEHVVPFDERARDRSRGIPFVNEGIDEQIEPFWPSQIWCVLLLAIHRQSSLIAYFSNQYARRLRRYLATVGPSCARQLDRSTVRM